METRRKFYKITHAQGDTKGFAWALDFGPLNGPMPFFYPNQLERKLESWKIDPRRPGLYIEDAGGPKAVKWPDFLGHGGGFPSFFVSRKVVESLTREGIEIARLTAMPIAEISCNILQDSAPDYFVLEAPHAIEMDYAASGVPTSVEGTPVIPMPRSPVWKLKLATWTGHNLFASPNIWKRPSCSLVSTERIVELAKRDGWTNCRFDPIWAV